MEPFETAFNVALFTASGIVRQYSVLESYVGQKLDILVQARDRPATNQLTLAQGQEIVSDPKLFLIAWLVLNRAPLEDIVRSYKFSEREVMRLFYKLDSAPRLSIVIGVRASIAMARRLCWRCGRGSIAALSNSSVEAKA